MWIYPFYLSFIFPEYECVYQEALFGNKNKSKEYDINPNKNWR